MEVKQPQPPAAGMKKLDRLARLVRQAGAGDADRIRPRAPGGRVPLSFGQERLWVLSQLENSAAYNLGASYRLDRVDAAALERALGEIVRRHESLRTTFAEAEGGAVQVIAPFTGFSLPVEDLSHLDPQAREEAVRTRVEAAGALPYDLCSGPLFRPSLLRLGAQDVLMLNMHHIVSDGWSIGVLLRELGALYAAYRQGGQSPLPELAIQYADYALWQRERLQGEALDRQTGYWKERLAGAPALLELPTDRPRPAVQSQRGARQTAALPEELAESLRTLAREESATLFMVLLAAFQVLLGRYAGSDDVVVGTPVAGRGRSELEGLIGFFVNTLVLRTDLGGDPTFRETLRRVRPRTLDAYEHQDLPFEKLVAELQPERSLGHSPLFQVLFTLQDGGGADVGLPGATPEGLDAELAAAKFDLSLTLTPTSDGMVGGMVYNTDLFDRATIQRMLGHLQRVLEQAVARPDVRLSEVQLLSAEERAVVVDEWNRTEQEYDSERRIPLLIQAQAARTPDAVAVVFDEASLTYRQLDARANCLANHLVGLGAGPEARVGICLERGLEMVVAMLGVLKAGAAYLPLDPRYPADRLAYMLEDSGARVLVTESALRGLLPAEGVRIVSVDADAQAIAAESADAPQPALQAENTAYVIYTSGSTGKPKGVQVTHGNAASFFAAMDGRVGGTIPGTWLALTRISFDIHVLELLWTLARGFKVVVHPDVEQAREDLTIDRQIRRHGVTHMQCTPSLAAMLIAESGIEALAGLERLLLGGEALPADLAARITAVLPGGLINMYGPTETTVWSTTHTVDGAVFIGRPIANTRTYVLDAGLHAMPAGVPGELYIGGAGVTRGYLNRPGLTAERFVPDPFAAEGGARMYRTGDRARWRADGTLEYLDRLDAQVKVRGFRIEPGEIEAVLRRHPQVSECAVVARGAADEKRLVAYIVGTADADALREHLRGSLPEYMVPTAFVTLDALPLTPNGKLDRRALPEPDFVAGEDRYVAPRTPLEEVLAGVWCEVLRVERVGVQDSFFTLGGHSLMATRVVSRVREVVGVELPLRAMFEEPTLAALARAVERIRRDGRPVPPPVVPTDRTGPLPLSFAQERLWFLNRMEPDSANYNIPLAMRFTGALHAEAMERALAEIVRRHDSLRTTFREVEGVPAQVIGAFEGYALPVTDLSALAHEEREAEVRRLSAEDAARPFDLTTGPLFRITLLRLAQDEHVLLVCMHHIISDGWSLGVLFRELSALYGAYVEGGASPLPELAVQYADYAAWQREHLRGEVLDRQMSYWKTRLAGAPALLEVPADRPRPAVQTYHGATERIDFPSGLLERLRTLGRAEGATLYMVILGAFQAMLAKYSGTEDIVVGTPIAGRTRGEVEALIGFFVNTLVLRTELGGDPGFRHVLRRVRETTLGAYEHQEVPFEKLVAELQPERSLSHAPLFQVMFTLDDAGGGGDALPGMRSERVNVDLTSARVDLSLSLGAAGESLRGSMVYSTDLFDRATIRRMLGHLGRVLEQVTENPDARLSELDLLSAEERAVVVEEWSRTEQEYDSERRTPLLIQAQAARTPDAVAVVFDDASLTYRELDQRANRLANHLVGFGVGPEARVGICLERGLEMVVAMLGVLKAGAAYLPLDPRYPADRLAYMLQDSGARVLVTESALRGLLPAEGVRIVSMDGVEAAIAAESDEAPRPALQAENTAYVIYTSGSTGKPKGVQVTHGNAASFFAAMDERVGGTIPGTWLALTRISFDIHVLELLWTLARGFKVVVHPDVEQAREDLTIDRQIRRHGVTHMQCTPSLAAMLIAESGIEALAGLERLLLGGEALPADLAARITSVLPGGLINMYGPTETTVWSTTHAVDAGAVFIGRPIANTRTYVLDAGLHAMPAGVPGELYIGGAGVTRGYLNRPGLTAERFVPDPFATEAGSRMYRTGDRARWRADGTLEYLDRLDAQVKVRGFRIEPGEIETVLRRHPDVSECAVVARAAADEKRLVAYIVGTAEADALREHLRGSLPDYMVPAAFVTLDALPLTPNGKLDRRALPEPEFVAGEDRYVAPRTPLEEVLAGVWCEVLRVERVGVHDSFFALGGHSLMATRVVSRIREVVGVELPLRAMFEEPTLAALARAVERIRRDGRPVPPPVVPTDRTGPLPLSFAQERLWFLNRMEPDSANYNIPVAVRFSGALHAEAMERAVAEIVHRHESLRTTFREVEGVPSQVIGAFEGYALPVTDLSALPETEREAEVRRLSAQDAARPFDLTTGPLFRITLLRLAEDEHVLLVCMHHIISDGWSLGVLFRELSALYGAYAEGGASPLPELAVQYGDYAAWQREHLRGEALDRQMSYWKTRLAGAPALLEVPADRPRPAVQTYHGATERVEFPAGLLERLRELGRREGATLYMVILGAFQAMLATYSGTEDIVVGTPIAGRTRGEVEALIGFFVNTLVLRTELDGDPGFRDVLRRVRETTLSAYEHQEVPFEKLVAELQPERSLSRAPLFQVMFTLEDAGGGGDALPGLRSSPVNVDLTAAKVDLSLSLGAAGESLRGSMVYSTDLFDRATIRRMLGHLGRVLEQVTENPDARLSELDLLSAEERAVVVEEWNRTEEPYDSERRIPLLIQAQAARTPDAVAVVFDEASLTYQELDARANRLANHLAGFGVAAEARVGICLERGLEMVVATLGVLKAGAAYLPLDPRYPADRLAYMLEDSGARVLVTESSLRQLLPAEGVRIVSVDADAAVIAAESADAPRPALQAENTAYVIYTSGSTGKPKGVQVTHENAASFFAGMDGRVGGTIPGTWLALTRISFDIHVLELLWTLARGFKVVVHPDVEQAREDLTIDRQIRRHGVTHMQCTPSLAAMLLAQSGAQALSGLERLLLGGEALPADLAARITEVLPGGLVNMYGPTETTVWSTTHAVEAGGPVFIGRPIANTRTYVLDAGLHAMPAGVPGELYIGGAGVTRGYLNRPALTAERFVPDPFAVEAGSRMYRTGDRARWRAEGILEYLDRLDAQVKVRGLRIEPGEIEAALRRHPDVSECAVVARGAANEKRLVAYVVGTAEAETLREHLRGSLPDYMVPAAFVTLDALPLTPNGKLDRKALPEPAAATAVRAYVAPRTPSEQAIAAIWMDILGLERVGVDDNFFDLGGHSLMVMQVVARIRRDLKVELPVRVLFEATTLVQLADRADKAEPSTGPRLLRSRTAAERSAYRVRLPGKPSDGG